jgi:uncharacterized protein (TIGR03086 family)
MTSVGAGGPDRMETTMLDLGPAAATVAEVVTGVRDDQLTDPTPCAGTPVAALLDHVHGLAVGLALAGRKDAPPDAPPHPDAAHLPADWRTRVPAELDRLVAVWRDPQAWQGTADGAGMQLPGSTWGRVTLNELVVHGWDLAVATGQPYPADAGSVAACLRYVVDFDADLPGARDGIYGPVVPVPDDAPALDRLLGRTGRHPHWQPAAQATTG